MPRKISTVLNNITDQEFNLFGMYQGIVRDNDDPLKLGRLKIFVPGLHKEKTKDSGSDKSNDRKTEDYTWSTYVSPFGGMHNAGVFMVPDIGSVVVVGFFAGDIDSMFWIGGTFDPNSHNPPIANIGSKLTEYPKNRILKTPKGAMIELDDSDGYERIEITSKNGNTIAIEDYRDNTIKVHSKGDMIFESGGSIYFNASEAIGLNANKNVGISSGNNIDMSCPNDVNVERNLNVLSDINTHNGDINLVDGNVRVNGNVGATGNVLCEGASSGNHKHIVVAEAIDLDPEGKEIIDTRMIRANHQHEYNDKHIYKDHGHAKNDKGIVVPIPKVNEKEPDREEFNTTRRVTMRDTHQPDVQIETMADENSAAVLMEYVDGKTGRCGEVIDSKPQQNVKEGNPASMLDETKRKINVIIEQVDRDYYKKDETHDTPYAVMRHKHSVRGIAI